jgi:multiple sugar transport system substrate-binding protein
MKRKVKPFTLFLLLFSLIFLIMYPIWIRGRMKKPFTDPFQAELPEWSGVIELWDIPYVQAGKGSHIQWLKSCINSFERKHPGVFIDVRTMTPERLNMYMSDDIDRDILPDIISLDIYQQSIPGNLLEDLSPLFSQDDLAAFRDPALQRVMYDERMLGAAYMMGCYGLYVNQDAFSDELDLGLGTTNNAAMDYVMMDLIARKNTFQRKSGKKNIDYYGFCTYANASSKPLLSMIYQKDGKIRDNDAYRLFKEWMKEEQDIMPPGMESLSYSSAFRLFALEKRTGMLLGGSKVIYDMRNLQESGKGVEYQVYPLPLGGEPGFYMDQIAAYGLLNQENEKKKELCMLFLKSLLQEEAQNKLKGIGMFSVRKDLKLYEDDAEMLALEQSLDRIVSGPWGVNNKAVENLWNSLFGINEQIINSENDYTGIYN